MRFAAFIFKDGPFEPTVEESQKVLLEVLKQNHYEEWANPILNYIIGTRSIPELHGCSVPGGLAQKDSKLVLLADAQRLVQHISPNDEWRLLEFNTKESNYFCCIGYKQDDLSTSVVSEWEEL